MKTVLAGLDSHLQQNVTSIATRWKLTRRDGAILGFTNHVEDIVISGVNYSASSGERPSSIASGSSLAVDNLEVIAILEDDQITEAALLAGLYDYATIEIAEFNYEDTSQGSLILRSGTTGEHSVGRGLVKVELRGRMQVLQQVIGRLHSKRCDADLGDARCKVRLAPPTWTATTVFTARTAGDAATGSVVKPSSFNDRHFKCTTAGTSAASEPSWNTTLGGTTSDGSAVWTAIEALTVSATVATAASRLVFSSSAIARADGWFDAGKLTWTSGLNSGLAMEVKRWTDASNTLELQFAMPFAIQVGDAFNVQAGCDLLRATCKTKFDNIRNFRGFPDMPTRDAVLAYPDSPT